MNTNTIIYLAVSLVVVFLVLISSTKFGFIGTIIIILALLTILILATLAFADFLIFPLFTKILNITIIPSRDTTISKSQEAVIKSSNGIYYATGYLSASVYNYVFAEEEPQEDTATLVAAPDKWEKATMNIGFPFKFNVLVCSEDVQKFRDELEAKRGLLEFQYSRETNTSTPNAMELENIQRQIRVIQTRIDKLGGGLKPLNSLMYVESIAVGVSEKDAMDRLSSQLSELQTVLNIFDLSIIRVVGRELYLLYRLNYSMPSLDDLAEQFDLQK